MEAPHATLRLRVVPGANRPGVVGRHGDAWKIRVAAPPEGDRANEAALALVAETVGVPRRDLELTAGRASRDKVVTVTGVTLAQTDERLAQAVKR